MARRLINNNMRLVEVEANEQRDNYCNINTDHTPERQTRVRTSKHLRASTRT